MTFTKMKLTGMSYKMACYFAHCCLSSLLYKYWWNFFRSLLSGNIFALSPVIMIEQFSQSIGQGSKDPRQIFTVFSSSLLCSSKQHLSFHSLTHSLTHMLTQAKREGIPVDLVSPKFIWYFRLYLDAFWKILWG